MAACHAEMPSDKVRSAATPDDCLRQRRSAGQSALIDPLQTLPIVDLADKRSHSSRSTPEHGHARLRAFYCVGGSRN